MDLLKSISTLFTDLTESYKERLKNPLWSAFLVSWPIFNWKALYFFFVADEATQQKISTIENHYLNINTSLFFPVCTAVIFSIAYPAIKNLSNAVWNISDNFSNRLANRIIKSSVRITIEEQEELFNQMEQQSKEHRAQIESYRSEIHRLKSLSRKIDILEKVDNSNSNDKLTGNDIRISNDALTNFINSTDGDYVLRKFIAPKMLLEMDDPQHKRELEIYYVIFKSIITDYPEAWFLKEINANSQNLAVSAVKAHVKKLSNAGLITITQTEKRTSATLSKGTLEFLTDAMSQKH